MVYILVKLGIVAVLLYILSFVLVPFRYPLNGVLLVVLSVLGLLWVFGVIRF